MRRNPFLVAMHSLLTAGLICALVLELVNGDEAWRIGCTVIAAVCLWLVRDDLTRETP